MRLGGADATLSQQSCYCDFGWPDRAVRCGGPALPPGGRMLGERRMELQSSRHGEKAMQERRSAYSYEDLLACGRGEMFGAGNAQLPLPPMLMFDRISEIAEAGGEYGKGMVRA